MGKFARGLGRLFGYDVLRYRKSFSFNPTLDRLLRHFTFDGVLDVGANKGLFSRHCLKALPGVPVVSFEPTEDLARELSRGAAAEPRWTIVQKGLSDTPGEAVLNTSSTSVFNSINAANPDFVDNFKGLTFSGQQAIELTTLDAFSAGPPLAGLKDMLIKVDTQGHDFKVLQGGRETLKRARAVIVELPFQNIYASGDTHGDILAFMDAAGFDVYSLAPISSDAKGKLVEADGFFLRRGS